MKKVFKFSNLLLFGILLLAYGCNDDDDTQLITLQDLEVTVDENPTNGQVIGIVQSDGNNSLTFSLTTQTPAGALTIDSVTGELSVSDATLFDFEVNPIITANVAAEGAANDASVTISLNNINELSTQDFAATLDENPANGDVIGMVQAAGDGILIYSITSQTPTGALGIDSNTGELIVADESLFDFETHPVLSASILVDNSGNTESLTATINLNNINELSIQDFTATIDENPASGSIIGTVQAMGDGTLSFSITSQTPAGAFAIDATSGELSVADASLFDFEANPSLTATIAVSNAGSTETGTANITLNDLDESAAVGDVRDGGVVFWVDPTDNNHGLIISLTNQSFAAEWGCVGVSVPGTSTAIGSGAANTLAIEAACTTPGTAADLAANWDANGYDDWFLPSRLELNEYYLNRDVVNPVIIASGGAIPNQFHWTSTEGNSNFGILVNTTTGTWGSAMKEGILYGVRAIRAF